jgi:hypothetical protein
MPDIAVSNAFCTLKLPVTASRQEVEHAFREMALLYHPDKTTDKSNRQVFLDVNNAKDTIMDRHSFLDHVRPATPPASTPPRPTAPRSGRGGFSTQSQTEPPKANKTSQSPAADPAKFDRIFTAQDRHVVLGHLAKLIAHRNLPYGRIITESVSQSIQGSQGTKTISEIIQLSINGYGKARDQSYDSVEQRTLASQTIKDAFSDLASHGPAPKQSPATTAPSARPQAAQRLLSRFERTSVAAIDFGHLQNAIHVALRDKPVPAAVKARHVGQDIDKKLLEEVSQQFRQATENKETYDRMRKRTNFIFASRVSDGVDQSNLKTYKRELIASTLSVAREYMLPSQKSLFLDHLKKILADNPAGDPSEAVAQASQLFDRVCDYHGSYEDLRKLARNELPQLSASGPVSFNQKLIAKAAQAMQREA